MTIYLTMKREIWIGQRFCKEKNYVFAYLLGMLNLARRPAAARPVIPKRGEKEFEPRAHGGTNLQVHVLERSRAAMLDTLRTTRTISRQWLTLPLMVCLVY